MSATNAPSPERSHEREDVEEGGQSKAIQLRQLSDAAGKLDSHRGAGIQEISFLNLSYTIPMPNLVKQRGPKKPKAGDKLEKPIAVAQAPSAEPAASSKPAHDDSAPAKPDKNAKLHILTDISGQAQSGEMLALMGPSGSGKTSLLNVLAQRMSAKHIQGGVYCDGKPLDTSFKRRFGFVFQDDIALWNLTVRETVLFAAKLKMPQSIPLSEKEARVDELIEKLGISSVANSIIGKEGRRGISGGERKRVAVGVELVTGPSVLFLDEPTSGLDSSTALSIITLLNALARGGMIVICSIHQPRANIFSQFSKVLLLMKGRTAYYGQQRDMVDYFTRLGLELPRFTNPADWVLDLTAGKAGDKRLYTGETLTEAYANMVAKLTPEELAARDLPTEESIATSRARYKDNVLDTKWQTTFWYQLQVLLERQGKQSRGEAFSIVNIGQIIAVCIIASAVWWQSSSIKDINGVLFFVSLQQGFNALSSIMRIFPSERSLMVRERSTGTYRVGPYFISKSLSDSMLYLVWPALYGLVVYFCVGLRTSPASFFIFLLVFLTEIMTAQSIGMLVSAAIKDFAAAQSFSFVLVLLIMLFGGFYVNSERIPVGIRWMLRFLYWGYGALLVNEYRGRDFPCSYADASAGPATCIDGRYSGDEVLKEYGFQDMKIWENEIIMIAMFFAFRFLTYVVLRKTTKLRG